MTDTNETPETPDEPVKLEVVESIEMTEQDEADLRKLMDEEPSYHPLLQIWSEVLAPAEEEATKRVTPQWAMRMVSQYPQLKLQDMNELRDRFYSKIKDLRNILQYEIESDPDCYKRLTMESDAEENREHYLNLLMNWQKQILQWEISWDCTDAKSHIEVAAISEVHKMFFSQEGLTGFLDNIGFEFSEEDGETLAAALAEMKEGHE